MSKEAMKLALEALEELTVTERTSVDIERGETAITALQEALAEQPAQQEPVTPCTHPSLGFSSLREDGAASRWSCVMCGTEFVPKATQRWTEFNEATKRNIEHAEWYLSTHPQPAQQEPCTRVECMGSNGCIGYCWNKKPAQQEPVGYFSVNDYGRWEENENEHGQPFYTSPPAQRKEDK